MSRPTLHCHPRSPREQNPSTSAAQLPAVNHYSSVAKKIPTHWRLLRMPGFHIRVSTLVCSLLLLALSTACQTQATGDTRAADEAVLRKLDDEWSKAAGARDVDKTISYYTDDAVVMPPNIPTLTGKEPIRSLWKSMLDSPSFSGGWKATKVEVARSGDLAYVSGNYEFT